MGLFGKSKKERETEYMSRLDVPSCLKEDFELIIDDIFTIMGVGTVVILSRLVDTFFSRISLTMQPPPKPHSTACVLPWEEGRHWQSRSSGCSSS